MLKRYNILLLLLLLFVSTSLFSQMVELSIIQKPTLNDSSYYDINRIDEKNFWVVGKYGVINSINENGIIKPVKYPNKGVNLYKVENIGSNITLICGDKGSIYSYDKQNNKWSYKQLPKYKNHCFYSMSVINDSTAFICGGHRKIGIAKKAVPNGFILKTIDKGKTWERVYKNNRAMVWSLNYHKPSQKVYAVCYSITKSQIICSNQSGTEWVSVFDDLQGLFHDFIFTPNENLMLAGSKNHKFQNNAKIFQTGLNSSLTSESHGMFWGLSNLGKTVVACGYNGATCVKNENNNWLFLNNIVNTNLYEIATINNKSAYIIGSWKTILKITLSY